MPREEVDECVVDRTGQVESKGKKNKLHGQSRLQTVKWVYKGDRSSIPCYDI